MDLADKSTLADLCVKKQKKAGAFAPAFFHTCGRPRLRFDPDQFFHNRILD